MCQTDDAQQDSGTLPQPAHNWPAYVSLQGVSLLAEHCNFRGLVCASGPRNAV